MKKTVPDVLEKGRIMKGALAELRGEMAGAFAVRSGPSVWLLLVVSDGADWETYGFPPPAFEHVSVSVNPNGSARRLPTWEEMCFVKGLLWEPEELVIQYHPPASQYVNTNPFVLHLWKPVGISIPLPPQICV